MEATRKAARFVPNSTEIGILSGIVLTFFSLVLQRSTNWDIRICFLIVGIPIWVAQGFVFKTPPKRWAIQVGAYVAFVYSAWWLLGLVSK